MISQETANTIAKEYCGSLSFYPLTGEYANTVGGFFYSQKEFDAACEKLTDSYGRVFSGLSKFESNSSADAFRNKCKRAIKILEESTSKEYL